MDPVSQLFVVASPAPGGASLYITTASGVVWLADLHPPTDPGDPPGV